MSPPDALRQLREWLNGPAGRWVAGGFAVAALTAAAAIFLRDDTAGRAEAIRARGHTVYYVCKACGQTGRTHKPFEETYPVACPQCWARQAVEGFPCVNCDHVLENPKKEILVFHCPHCRFTYNRRALGG
jgi:DNA-directed RNA polymerase subunit RPC12/RpoP